MRARSTDRWDDEIAHAQGPRSAADLDDLTEGFMAEDEVIGAIWRRPVVEIANLPVGAADAAFDGADLYLVRLCKLWGRMRQYPDLPAFWDYADCAHALTLC
jgi:hypothetical protein